MAQTDTADAAAPVAASAPATSKLADPRLQTEKPANAETWHEVAQLLHRESRLICEELFDEWLETIAHPDIRYKAFNKQLRMRRDRRFTGADIAYAWNERLEDLEIKVRAWQSGMQWSSDPKERLRHHIGNVEVYQGEVSGELIAYANCWVVRNRRVYDEMTFSYGRRDVWLREADGRLRLKQRVCDIDERFIHGKNLAFFL